MSSNQDAPSDKPIYVLFMALDCQFCHTLLNKLKPKEELMKKFNIVNINNIPAIPDEIDEIPCIYDGQKLYKGKDAFKWLNEKLAEHLSAANDGLYYSFLEGQEEQVFGSYSLLDQKNGSYGMGSNSAPNEQNLGDPTRMMSVNDNTNKNRTMDSLMASRDADFPKNDGPMR